MRAPVLAVGIGSWGSSDDAAGLLLAQSIANRDLEGVEVIVSAGPPVELLERSERTLILVLDAVRLGAPPGSVHLFSIQPDTPSGDPASHRWSAVQWLGLRQALGCHPCPVAILGIEPASLDPGFGVAPAVMEGIALAVTKAEQLIGDARRGTPLPLASEPHKCF